MKIADDQIISGGLKGDVARLEGDIKHHIGNVSELASIRPWPEPPDWHLQCGEAAHRIMQHVDKLIEKRDCTRSELELAELKLAYAKEAGWDDEARELAVQIDPIAVRREEAAQAAYEREITELADRWIDDPVGSARRWSEMQSKRGA